MSARRPPDSGLGPPLLAEIAPDLRRLASVDLEDVPAWVFARAAAAAATASSAWLEAELARDTLREPLQFGVRSASSPARHLLYRVSDYDLTLRVALTDEKIARVIGQVLPPEQSEPAAGAHVVLAHERYGIAVCRAGALGEFVFDAVPEGDYELVVETPDYRLVVSDLPVRGDA